jgi:hypothetical protein
MTNYDVILVQILPYAVMVIVIVAVIRGNILHNLSFVTNDQTNQQLSIYTALDVVRLQVTPSIAAFEFTEELQKIQFQTAC